MESQEPFTVPRQTWLQKFAAAFRGCYLGTRGQSSFLVHIPVAVTVLIAAAAFQVSTLEWCLLIVCIAGVLATELANSALETLAKAVSSTTDLHIAQALDIASSAVLVSALGAAACGLVIFLPRLWVIVGWVPSAAGR